MRRARLQRNAAVVCDHACGAYSRNEAAAGIADAKRGGPVEDPTRDGPPIRAAVVPVTPLQQNCTIVWCARTRKAAVIDPGGEVPRLLQILKEQDLTLEKIWITHGHLDHAGGTAALKAATGVPVEGPHVADRFWIDDIAQSGARWGMSEARSFEPDRWLGDGSRVTLGDTEFDVNRC